MSESKFETTQLAISGTQDLFEACDKAKQFHHALSQLEDAAYDLAPTLAPEQAIQIISCISVLQRLFSEDAA